MTKSGLSAIAVVLDRSGSMESIRQATIDGFNEFLKGQQAVGGEATLSLVQFDHEYEVVHDFAPLTRATALDGHTYVPRGSTALLDAIGRTINALGARLAGMPEAQRPSRVLVTIITDGFENASREFTRGKVFEMITHQREKYGWEFMFLAANQDAIASGREFGIDGAYSASFNATAGSARKAFRMASAKQSFSRSMGTPAEAFSDADRADLLSDHDEPAAPRSPTVRRDARRGGNQSPTAV